jgi:hypothetical protein
MLFTEKLKQARMPGLLAFLAVISVCGFLVGGLQARLVPPIHYKIPDSFLPDWLRPYFFAPAKDAVLALSEIKIEIGAKTLAVIAAVLILAIIIAFLWSSARFFFAATSIVVGQLGGFVFDILHFAGFIQDSDFITLKVVRTSDWRINVPLTVLAGILYWLDHIRRPART